MPTILIVLLILLAIICGLRLFFRFYRPFGGRTPRSQKATSPHFKDGKFVNQVDTPMTMSFKDAISLLRDQFNSRVERRPKPPLVPEKLDIAKWQRLKGDHLTWFGHSAFLMRLGGLTILLDPMLGPSPSPFSWAGPKRYSRSLPASVEQLPPIDAVVISHDHYDHLDYPTIKKLAGKAQRFFVPLGLKAHLLCWDVPADRIVELDWWDEATYHGVTFACTPSRHFSGRTLGDRFETLWASWAITTSKHNIYFSGDSGYGPHFKQIGDKYGPFDLTLMECGQYDRRWANIHMLPEDTLQAHLDLRGKLIIPIHWGAFSLALHDWREPAERLLKAAQIKNKPVATPKIGQTVQLFAVKYPTTRWWKI